MTANDRERLEKAAFMAGLSIKWHEWDVDDVRHGQPTINDALWNPLNDNEDAFRLAYALRLTVDFALHSVSEPGSNIALHSTGSGMRDMRSLIVQVAANMRDSIRIVPAEVLP